MRDRHSQAQQGAPRLRRLAAVRHLQGKSLRRAPLIAQPRSLGRKVSDEFTVPLCRTHHHELHREGNEVGWANMQVAPQASKTQICREFFHFDLFVANIQSFNILISFSYL